MAAAEQRQAGCQAGAPVTLPHFLEECISQDGCCSNKIWQNWETWARACQPSLGSFSGEM